MFHFSGKPYGDDNNDLYNNEDYTDPSNPPADDPADEPIYKLPKFVTKSQNLMVNEGSTIRLPCVGRVISDVTFMMTSGLTLVESR